MSTKTTFKRIALVAVATLGFGMLSVVPSSAVIIDADVTNTAVPATGSVTTSPAAQGTAVVVTLNLKTDAAVGAGATTIASTFVLTDPNGTPVTASATFTAADATVTLTANSNTLGVYTSTLGATAGALTRQIGTMTFTPAMGGTYVVSTTKSSTTGDFAVAALSAASATAGSIFVSGVNVSQGTTRGNPGNAQTASQGKVVVTFPTHAGSESYRITSSGVGAIVGNVIVGGGSSANISGSSTDFSAGLTHTNFTNNVLASETLSLISNASGVQTITVQSISPETGVLSNLYSTTITWTATPALSPTISIVRIAPAGLAGVAQGSTAATASNYSATRDAIPYFAPRAIGNNVAQVQVILLNSNGTAATGGHTVTASVSGSGFVLTDTSAAATNATARSEGQTLTAGSENVAFIHISGDGTSGTGTINISVTDVATGATTVLPSKTVTFTGSVASLTVSTTNFTIGKAGAATGAAAAARDIAGEVTNAGALNTATTTPAFIVSTTDSGGRLVTSAAAPTVVSSNTTVVTGGTCILDNGQDGDFSSTVPSAGGTNGVGVYNCNFSTASIAKSGDKATLTIRVSDPASATGGFLTTTLAVTVGGSASTETIALNKESYEPGEAMIITRTAKDSAGNPVADGTAAPAIRFSKSVGGTTPVASRYLGGVSASASSLAKSAVFAPTSTGAFSALATSGNAAASALTATATVAADAAATELAQAAADAAAEATDAANAATDAANAAAEAADAATAAAQDAADAVAALATQVTEQVNALKMQNNNLRKQLVALTNLIIKIQKKVNA